MAGIVEILGRRRIDQREVVAHQPGDRDARRLAEADPLRNVEGDRLTHLAVVSLLTLAEVVQDRGRHEQVGSLDVIKHRRQLHAGLHEVPVDGEAMHRRLRPQVAHPLPLRKHRLDDAVLVEALPDVDQRRSRCRAAG